MDVIKLLKAVLKQYKIILGCTVFVALLVYVFTINISKKYESTATIYTGIGTAITPGSLESKSDWLAQSSSFDNLLNIITSRETLKEVGLRMLASHLTLKESDPKFISQEHLANVRELIPPDIKKMAGETDSITYQNLAGIADSNPFLIGVINYPTVPYYSTAALSGVSVNRLNNSDMISLTYATDDPGVCQKTLEVLIEVCIRNYRKINEGQVDKVVSFYEGELQAAQKKLKQSEAREQKFKEANNVVDYTTQTGMVLSDRQNILDQIQKEQEVMSATAAAIRQIEGQLGVQAQSLKKQDIINKTEQVRRLSIQLNNAELNKASQETIASLQSQIGQVKSELNHDISSSLSSPSGKTNDVAATEYFNKLVASEESKARLKVLENRRDAAMGQFVRFLPLGDTLKRIQREIDINEKAYYTALNKLIESKGVQMDKRSFSSIQVIDAPNYPLISKSVRKILIMMGAALGFIIPAFIFLGLAYFNSNIQTPQRAEEITGLKIAGIVPNSKKLQAHKHSEQISDGLSDTILKNLYLTNHKGNQQRILIISTRPSEGKTMISNMLCQRLISKGRKCLVVMPYLESGSWSVVSYKVDNAFYQARAADLVPVEKLNDADILILELPSLIMSDYPVALIKEFDMAFLVCDANRDWAKADQTALDSFIKISGITPQIILNDVELEVVEEVLGKIS